MREITLSHADIEGAGELSEIAASSDFCAKWSAADFESEIGNKFARIYTALCGKEIAGFAAFRLCAGEGEITNFAVKARYRRRGVGGMLLAKCIESASAEGVRRITLEVSEANGAAIALYEKFKFKTVSVRKKFYNNSQDALLMLREI